MEKDTNGSREQETARWPQDGDRLFVASTWVYDAPVVRDPGERFYRMPKGYKRAGDLLVQQAGADVADRPNIIYPALFCYRQAIELFLKKIIVDFGGSDDSVLKNTHALDELWARFMRIVKQRDSATELGLTAVAQIVAELNDADRKSDGFRFPADRQNAPFAFGDIGIDLENLLEIMSGVANFFECAHLAFAHQDEVESELRAAHEFRSR
jgi:hypothetical protein